MKYEIIDNFLPLDVFDKLKTFNSELEKRVEARTSELKDANIQLEKCQEKCI